MGSIQKHATISGRTLAEAFNKLQKADLEEYGNDIYNGGWNNSTGVREVSAKEFDKRVKAGDISKHESAIAVCTVKPKGNTNKVKTTVTNFPVKGARKWVTRYEATSWKHGYEKTVVSESSQTVAIKKAREYVEKNPGESLDIEIVKTLIGQNPKVATIKYKKSTTERPGRWEVYGAMSY